MLITDEQLKSLVIKNSLIDEKGFSEIVEDAKNSENTIAETLVEKDIVSDENLGILISDFLKYPFIILAKITIPPDVFNIIRMETVRRVNSVDYGNG